MNDVGQSFLLNFAAYPNHNLIEKFFGPPTKLWKRCKGFPFCSSRHHFELILPTLTVVSWAPKYLHIAECWDFMHQEFHCVSIDKFSDVTKYFTLQIYTVDLCESWDIKVMAEKNWRRGGVEMKDN